MQVMIAMVGGLARQGETSTITMHLPEWYQVEAFPYSYLHIIFFYIFLYNFIGTLLGVLNH